MLGTFADLSGAALKLPEFDGECDTASPTEIPATTTKQAVTPPAILCFFLRRSRTETRILSLTPIVGRVSGAARESASRS
jgi:hypothetical protein